VPSTSFAWSNVAATQTSSFGQLKVLAKVLRAVFGCSRMLLVATDAPRINRLRALVVWHGRGHRFDPGQVHQTYFSEVNSL
jgi:hypothetical protein